MRDANIGVDGVGTSTTLASNKRLLLLPLIGDAAPDRDVLFEPTPMPIVRAMLALAQVGPTDVVYDLGSGDGRIPMTAAKEYGACGVGVEIDRAALRRALDRQQAVDGEGEGPGRARPDRDRSSAAAARSGGVESTPASHRHRSLRTNHDLAAGPGGHVHPAGGRNAHEAGYVDVPGGKGDRAARGTEGVAHLGHAARAELGAPVDDQ